MAKHHAGSQIWSEIGHGHEIVKRLSDRGRIRKAGQADRQIGCKRDRGDIGGGIVGEIEIRFRGADGDGVGDQPGLEFEIRVIDTVARPPPASSPREQVSTPFTFVHVPCVDSAETNVVFKGRSSVKETPVAPLGP